MAHSEGEELAGFLDALQREQEIREISGRDSGFANLNSALDGLLPGVYALIGAPGIGKTSFVKQLLDQVAKLNHAPVVLFSFEESKHELRIKTLARLSGLDTREIRRGSAYLLHWYGVPRLGAGEASQLSPSWEKVRRSAEEAQSWLNLEYLFECPPDWRAPEIDNAVGEVAADTGSKPALIVIDDCQRLGAANQPLSVRMPAIAEPLRDLAARWQTAFLFTWPDLENDAVPEKWAERFLAVDLVTVLQNDPTRSKKLNEPHQAMVLHIVKNRGGEKGRLAFDFFPSFARFGEA
jgi:replicative DNA helicase